MGRIKKMQGVNCHSNSTLTTSPYNPHTHMTNSKKLIAKIKEIFNIVGGILKSYLSLIPREFSGIKLGLFREFPIKHCVSFQKLSIVLFSFPCLLPFKSFKYLRNSFIRSIMKYIIRLIYRCVENGERCYTSRPTGRTSDLCSTVAT